ncbi:hypothetical protein EYF80_009733 [Liparis tanakae]|uniref:Uncharacterized protein n=1 Tax=Liparis tanakae TaxID=230148 RepID=A0A4Z2IQH2_9TELE|nr:hypothetical protein EYF80_009733 [Liparis tanakae]
MAATEMGKLSCHRCFFWDGITNRAAAPQPYLALLFKKQLACPVKELSRAGNGTTGGYNTELL